MQAPSTCVMVFVSHFRCDLAVGWAPACVQLRHEFRRVVLCTSVFGPCELHGWHLQKFQVRITLYVNHLAANLFALRAQAVAELQTVCQSTHLLAKHL